MKTQPAAKCGLRRATTQWLWRAAAAAPSCGRQFVVNVVNLIFPSSWLLISFCPFVSAAAVHACLRGSFPSGRSHLPLPSLQSGDSLHLLPGRLHHPPFHEPGHLWFSGRAVQKVLDPVLGLSDPKYHQGQTGVTESEPVGGETTTGELTVSLSSWFSSVSCDSRFYSSVTLIWFAFKAFWTVSTRLMNPWRQVFFRIKLLALFTDGWIDKLSMKL